MWSHLLISHNRTSLKCPAALCEIQTQNSWDFADRKQAFFSGSVSWRLPSVSSPQSSLSLSLKYRRKRGKLETSRANLSFYSLVVYSVGQDCANSSGLQIRSLFPENFILYCPWFSVTALQHKLYTMQDVTSFIHYTPYSIRLHFKQ